MSISKGIPFPEMLNTIQLNLRVTKSVKFAIYFVTMKFCYIKIWQLACKNTSQAAS